MKILPVQQIEFESAKALVKEVFMQFEAPDYSQEGVDAFMSTALYNDDFMSSLTINGAYEDDELIGVIATRNEGNHIALFFVKAEWQGKGVGRALFNSIVTSEMTVNSSPFAVKIYENLGFKKTNEEQCVDGIRFTPMSICLTGLSNMKTLQESEIL